MKKDVIVREEVKEVGSFARESKEVPRCSGTRAETGEVPEWLKSPGENSAGGGSDQTRSHDVQETMVNKDR